MPTTPVGPSISSASLPDIGEDAPVTGTRASAWWTWLAAALAVIAATLGGVWFLRNRRLVAAATPTIEPPLARSPSPPPAPTPSPPAAPPEPPKPVYVADIAPLAIDAAPVSLARSMRFASFRYRLTLKNRSETRIEDITVGVDLVTAHSSASTEDQLANAQQALPETGKIGTIEPGEEVEIAGEVSLPLDRIRTIRQGSAHLYVPLLRLRAEARNVEPVARTFLVGTLPEAGARKLQPFRLDELPQTYRNIGTAPLDR